MSILFGFLLQNLCQLFQRLIGIDDSRGVVRRIDKDCHDLFREQLFKCLKINLKAFRIGGHNLERRPRQIDIGMILREKGREGQYFVARLCHQPESMCKSARCTGCHKNVLLAVGQPEAPLQRSRNRLTHRGDSKARAVAVKYIRLFCRKHMHHGICKFLRHRYRRISKTVVKHILISDLLPSRRRELRKLPDHGLRRKHIPVFLNQHPISSCQLSVSKNSVSIL